MTIRPDSRGLLSFLNPSARKKSFILGTSIASILGLASMVPGAHAQEIMSGVFSTSGNLGLEDNDANVGLSTTKTYLNAVNLGATPPASLLINGVEFKGVGGGTPTDGNWSIGGATFAHTGGETTAAGQLGVLTNDFIYNGRPSTFTLNNLTIGETYVISFYNRAWDAPGTRREQEFTASDASVGSAIMDQDVGDAGQGNLNIMRYTFQASGSTQTLSINPLNSVNTMHIYGFSTEQVFNNEWEGGLNWSSANWSGAEPNGVGSNAAFGAQPSPTTITLDAARTVGHLRFDGTEGWTIGGSNTLSLQADVGGVSALSVTEGSHTIATPIELLTAAAKLGEGTLTLTGAVSGGKGLSVNGGTLVLSAENFYTGGTTVNTAGTLRLGATNALGSTEGALTVNTGGVLDLNGTQQTVGNFTGTGGKVSNTGAGLARLTIGEGGATGGNFRGVIADNVALTKTGAGTITLSGANTYTGATVINDGRLQLNGDAATGLNTSGIEVSGTGHLGFTAGSASTLTLKAGSTFTLAGGTVSIELGAAGTSDLIAADAMALTANSAFAFVPLAPLNYGAPYTIATFNSVANPGNSTLAPFVSGRLTVTPTIGANAITATASLDSGTWASNSGGVWNTGPWLKYTPNAVGDSAVFGNALTTSGTVALDGPKTVGYITFDNGAASYDIGAVGSSNLTLENVAFPAEIAVRSGSHTISENVNLGSNLRIATDAGTTLTAKGVISGARSLNKFGEGTLILTGASTYSGGTTISAGTLELGDGTVDGSVVGAITNNGSLVFKNKAAQTVASAISGTGQVRVSGAGKVTLTGNSTFSGGLTIAKDSSVDIGGETPNGSVIGNITNDGNLRFSRTGVITIDAVVNGSGTTVFAGGVSQNLSDRASINTPNVIVGDASQGYVYFGAPNQLNGTTGVVLHIGAHTANSRINLNGFDQTVAGLTGAGIVQNHETAAGTPTATLTINVPEAKSYSWTGLIRNMNGVLGLTKTGAGEQTMNFAITSASYTGATNIQQGRLTFGSTIPAPAWGTSGITIAEGAELGLTGAGTGVGGWDTSSRIISGTGSVVRVGNDSNVVTISNATNTYTGSTKLSGTGTLSVTGLANIGQNSAIGAGNATSDATNAASLIFDGGVLQYTGVGVSTNRLFTVTEKGGRLNASGTGALILTNPGTMATSGAGARTLTLAGTSAANNTLAGVLADGAGGATSLSKTGPGTWVLAGANTYTGTTAISGGRLLLEGNAATSSASANVAVNAGGTLAFTNGIGSTLTLANALTLNGGTTAFDIGSPAASDKIVANTLTLTADSTFSFNPIGLYEYGSTYTLATYTTLNNTGAFKVAGLTAGRLSLAPVVGATAITMTPTLDNAVWDSTAGGAWSNGPWTGYTPNASGDAALFGSKLAASGTVTVGAPTSVGYLTFSNSNASYTIGTAGGTNLTLANTGVNAALVVVEAGNHTIAEDVTLSNDVSIRTAASTSLTVNGALKGTARSVTKAGPGTLTLSGANNFATSSTGLFTINDGSVLVGSATGLPAGVGLRVNSGSLDLNGHDAKLASLAGAGGSISDNSAAAGVTKITIDQPTTTTYSGTILDGPTRSVALHKTGTGSVTLTGANTYSGGLTIMNGSIVAANPTGPSLRGEVVFGDGQLGVLDDKLFLIMGAPNQFAPGTTLRFASGERDTKLELRGFDQTVAGLDSTTAEIRAIIQNQEAPNSVGSATLTINVAENESHDFFGLIRPLGSTEGNSLNFLKTGLGTQIIRNSGIAQSNFGVATINQGKLTFNYELRTGGAGGHELLGGNTSFVVNEGGTLGLDGNWEMSRPVSGAGDVVKEGIGEVKVSGELTHTGNTVVKEGKLVLWGSISGSSVIEVQADATLDVFSASGGFTVGANQTLTGTGTIDGDMAVSGTLAPGPGIGTLTTYNVTFNEGGVFALEINTNTGASDLVSSSGSLTLDTGGVVSLSITDLGSTSLAIGTQFTLMNYLGEWDGGLFSVNGNPIADGGLLTVGVNHFELDYNAGVDGNNLALIAVPEPGAATLLLSGFAGLLGFRRRRA